MKKYYLLSIHFILLLSCANYPQSNKDVVGRYISLSEKKEDYFFEFYSDKTFVQTFINNNDTIFKIKGSWNILDNKGTISLSTWNEIGYKGKIILHSNGGTLLESNNTLFFSADDYTKNFKKKD